MTDNTQRQPLFHLLLITLLLIIMSALAYVVLGLSIQNLSIENAALGSMVIDNLEQSGVSNPVTAVLLNYRGYDTLLEMMVLFLAMTAVWSLGSIPDQPHSLPGSVLNTLLQLLIPLLILAAAYLLWVGAHAPGGAFQAGSLLGACGVLLLLTGWHLKKQLSRLFLRISIAAGLVVFVITGILPLFMGSVFLAYPQNIAGILILFIEVAAALSIGIILASLFLGGIFSGGHPETKE